MNVLRVGSTGSDVKRVQKKVGLTGSAVDGIFGHQTEEHVKHWQHEHHLVVDGIVGPLTWRKMFPIVSIFRKPKGIIVLDIGHGMDNTAPGVYDPGATAAGQQEHKRAEVIGGLLKARLEARGRVVRVIHDLPVGQRDDKAMKLGAKLFVPNHLNAGGGEGVEALVSPKSGAWVRALAAKIAAAIAKATGERLRNGDGVKIDVRGLAVFRLMPNLTVLIEWGFIDSMKDRLALGDTAAQDLIDIAVDNVAAIIDGAVA